MFPNGQLLLLDNQQQPFYRSAVRLGGRLRLAREKRELTQAELAEKASTKDAPISQAAISALEKRDSETTIYLFSLARILRVRPEWLQDGIEPSGLDGALTHQPEQDLAQEASDAEKLLSVVRAFLDTDAEGKDVVAKAVAKIVEARGLHATVRSRLHRRAKRR